MENVGSGSPGIAPVITLDNEFFWDGVAARRLLFQSCSACHAVRHPPAPACWKCQSFEWESVESAGQGEIFSYTVVHAPLPASVTEPYVVVVADLGAGIRFVAGVTDDSAPPAIGAPLELSWTSGAGGMLLPAFRIGALNA